MAHSRTATIAFPFPPDQLHRAGFDTLVELCKPESISSAAPNVIGTTRTTWKSWGEEIHLQVSQHGQGAAVVIISKSAMPTQIIDFGAHRKNVEKVLDALQGRLGAGQLLTPIA